MRGLAVPFFSSGARIDADLYLPDEGDGPFSAVIAASGYQGLKVIHPERFARALTPRGFAVLAFDYRGFGLSEGERGRLVPQEWAEDIRAAVDRMSMHPMVDPDRIGLLGWGLGGGVVVYEAGEDPRVKAVACCNGIADGYESTRQMHDADTFARLLTRVEADRAHRTERGRSEITSPWDIVRLDLDAQTETYVGDELYKAPGFGSGVTLESADYLLRFKPWERAVKIAPRELLIVHGENNELHKLSEAQRLYHSAAEPRRLEILPGKGHTEWMLDDDPTFQQLIETLDKFFSSALHVQQ
jgi:hypothetical protein